ncbi:MFS transporter [Jatrophihabitans sp. YIM 134969]
MSSLAEARPTDQQTARQPSSGVVLLLAVATGAAVANLYYAQPLLELIGRSLHVGNGAAAFLVTLTQIGYALGLILLVPLGDLVENRKLTSTILAATALTLVAATFAPNFTVLLIALGAVGVTSVVAQVLVPLAAHLAPPDRRGSVVGRVTSGLLLGIMLARSVSSFVAGLWGWRAIFGISAVLMIVIAVLIRKLLPQRQPESTHRYPRLIASTARLVVEEPTLMRRALGQSLLFAAFTAFWTGVTFELISAHGLSQTQVAVFALVGAAGAAAAPVAGWLGDRGHGARGRLLAAIVALAAMAVAGFGAGSVVLLAVGGVLLDLAVQTNQVLSLRDVYGLRPDARARLNSVYMASLFLTSAAASAVAGLLSEAWGWHAVTIFAAACVALAGLLWRPDRRPAAPAPVVQS